MSRTVFKIAIALVITGITLLALEIGLTLGDVPTRYPAQLPDFDYTVSPWWICAEAGCHYATDAVESACAAGELEGRPCLVNRQGFHDADDFVWRGDYRQRSRVLMLGDSFTFGMNADIGMSYVETLEATLPQLVVWNAAIPGTGTRQALASFEAYAPQLRPHLTILAFYENDFDDNLLPLDSWLNAVDPDGRVITVRKYQIDARERVFALDRAAIQLLTVYGKAPPANDWQRLLGSTRLGSLILRLRDSLAASDEGDEPLEQRLALTKRALADLRDAAATANSQFLVLMIPSRADLEGEGRRYQAARRMLRELGIAHVNLAPYLDRGADYMPPPDIHWSNAGHQKVGALLSACVEEIVSRGNLRDCKIGELP